MQIAVATVKTITGIVNGLAESEALPRSEAKTAIAILTDATNPGHNQEPSHEKVRLVTTQQVAEILQVSVKTVLRMNQSGTLAGSYITGSKKSLRFNYADVLSFIHDVKLLPGTV